MWTDSRSRALLLRSGVTAIAVTLVALTFVVQRHQLPLHWRDAARGGVIEPRPGAPLPAGLQSGDSVIWAQQSPLVRAVLINENVPSTQSYPLVVQRDGQRVVVPVRSAPVPQQPDHPGIGLLFRFGKLLILGLGLLTLWRGRSWSAWGLSLFALSLIVSYSANHLPAPPYWNLGQTFLLQSAQGPLALLGLYAAAGALTGSTARSQRRRNLAYVALLLLLLAAEAAQPILQIVLSPSVGMPAVLQIALIVLVLSAAAVPLVVLITGYARAKAEARLRIRWILTGTALLLPLMALSLVQQSSHIHDRTVLADIVFARLLLIIAIVGLYTYAVLRQRLVEVRVVLNRALVFALLMGLIVGFFALMENLIERSALGERAGLALEIGVPLALGVLFHQLHRRVEALVDKVFFQHEHNAREALREFVHDAGFVESPHVLIERAVEAFARHSGGQGAALYDAHGGGFMRQGVDPAASLFPLRLDQDDRALVRLRATLAPLDLHGTTSALGSEGLALPLSLRGHLFGVLVCGPRPAGRYAQAEIERLAQTAHEVGASLFALRAQANETELEAMRAALRQRSAGESSSGYAASSN